ncbi:MAG TPA: hypothetical protein VGR35_11520 [Tepidisphaeraceae bacterium]|nr:hypothetical protein [Tepidisphaeraceae bacterium]
MAIAFSCSCGRKINAKDEHAGKRVKCPGCQQPITVPARSGAVAAKPAAAMASAGAKSSAPLRKPPAAKPAAPAPVDDDLYDVREDAPPAKKPGRAPAAVAPASPWGDDEPGLDGPIAAPRPYMPSAGSPAAAPARGNGAAAVPAGAAPAAGLGTYASLGSKRGATAPPTKGAKVAGGLHLGGFAKFIIGAAILLPTTFFVIRQGPVKAVAEWDKAEVLGEDSARSVLMRVIHDMDVATMPPPDPDRDNRDGIPYHPQVEKFFYIDAPMLMWRMPDKVEFRGSTSFGPYEGWYYTREHRVECKMEWKSGDNLTVVGQCKPDSSVDTLTIDGIPSTDKKALSKKFDGYLSW